MKLFRKHYGDSAAPSIGSLNNLYNSLTNLDDAHFCTKEGKQMLLDPQSMFMLQSCREIKMKIDDLPAKFYTCEDTLDHYCKGMKIMQIVMLGSAHCSVCWKRMSKELPLSKSSVTMKSMSFTVSDDLQILSDASAFLLPNVHRLCISNTDGMTTRSTQFGFDNAMEMLKGLFVSQTMLTDSVLGNKRLAPDSKHKPKCGTNDMSSSLSISSKKFIIKALLQKSTSKLLFVQAKDDFVDFLFSLLAIPLGVLAHLFGGNTSFLGINNLYQSVINLDPDNLFMSSEEKAFLLKLPQVYCSTSNILPPMWGTVNLYVSCLLMKLSSKIGDCHANVLDPKGSLGCYIHGPSMFLITDDLVIMPFTMLSTISRLNSLNIPLSDVVEVEFDIGTKEALKIFGALLTSTTVFTDALAPARKIKKKIKQELDG